jgi:hypothetical protein
VPGWPTIVTERTVRPPTSTKPIQLCRRDASRQPKKQQTCHPIDQDARTLVEDPRIALLIYDPDDI